MSNIASNFRKNLNITENDTSLKNKENHRPLSLIDKTWEFIDPTPNIFALFMQFNEQFFWKVLAPVEVRWSKRMTSCAGTCSFHPRNRQCVISLSEPLLKLRPRKDLVETLLHEMIHGYLFLTNNNRDRDGHGPEFCKHMDRINSKAGTHITIYHSFHNEVRQYQQHWWKCNGPCKSRPPFYGLVRRAMNRAPGPYDYWYSQHQATCGGQFIKIKEPEKKENKTSHTGIEKRKNKTGHSGTEKKNNKTSHTGIEKHLIEIPGYVKKKVPDNTTNTTNIGISGTIEIIKKNTVPHSTSNVEKIPALANTASHNSDKKNNSPKNHKPRFNSTNILGGNKTNKSNLLDKYLTNFSMKRRKDNEYPGMNSIKKLKSIDGSVKIREQNPIIVEEKVQSKISGCPICKKNVKLKNINEHIDSMCKIFIESINNKTDNNDSSVIVIDSDSDTDSDVFFTGENIEILDASSFELDEDTDIDNYFMNGNKKLHEANSSSSFKSTAN